MIDPTVPRVRDGSYLPSPGSSPAHRASPAHRRRRGAHRGRLRAPRRRPRPSAWDRGISKSEVSRACARAQRPSQRVPVLAARRHGLPVSAARRHVPRGARRREGGSRAALVAPGLATGERWVLGLQLSPDHDLWGVWPRFVRSLVERRLQGVRLVISDDHADMVKAVRGQLLGAAWRRSTAEGGTGRSVLVSHPLDCGGARRLSLRVPYDRSGLGRLRAALARLAVPDGQANDPALDRRAHLA